MEVKNIHKKVFVWNNLCLLSEIVSKVLKVTSSWYISVPAGRLIGQFKWSMWSLAVALPKQNFLTLTTAIIHVFEHLQTVNQANY